MKVTICHWANGHPHTLTISENALGGHFDSHGSPVPGHEHDSFGACVPTTTQTTVPSVTTTTQPPHATTTTTVPATTSTTAAPAPTSTTTTAPITGTPTISQPSAPPALAATGFGTDPLVALALLCAAFGLWLRKAAHR